jgi:hypothetical protein
MHIDTSAQMWVNDVTTMSTLVVIGGSCGDDDHKPKGSTLCKIPFTFGNSFEEEQKGRLVLPDEAFDNAPD